MRDYPVTEAELDELFAVGLIASLCFFGGTASVGFAVTLFKDLSLAQGVPAETATFWTFARWLSLAVGMLLWAFGGLAFLFHRSRIRRIKKETTFEA